MINLAIKHTDFVMLVPDPSSGARAGFRLSPE
jgi:hypothetical protein